MASRRENRINNKIKYYQQKAYSSDRKVIEKNNKKVQKYKNKLASYQARKGDSGYRARQYSIAMSGLSTVIGVIIVYFLFNFLVDSTFQFNFISFVETLSNMPLISLTNIGAWQFPNWLSWLEPIAKGISILGASIANIAVIAVWVILILFGVPV